MSRYHKACGPAVAASVLGIPRTDVAIRLKAALKEGGAKRVAKSTNTVALAAVIAAEGVGVEETRYKKADRSTLRQWAASHQVGEYITLAANHFIHWRDGIAVEANGVPMAWRGKVRSTLRIVRETEAPRETPTLAPDTVVTTAGGYTGVVVEQHGMHVWVTNIQDSKGRIARPDGWLRADDFTPLER